MKKNILMIGGSYGIGLELAKLLSPEHNLYIASRTLAGLSDMEVIHIPFDALDDQLETAGLPDTLHGFAYCPGSINLKPFKTMSSETFEQDMEINFFGLVRVVKQIIARMAEGSSMVFFSTVAVSSGMAFHTSIAAAKGAIEGFSRALAAEYAPTIRVNVIAPSLVDTQLSARLLNNDKKQEMMAARHPLKRVGQQEDIAACAAFLLGDKSSWITGQIIGVDGGISTLHIN